MLKKKSDRVLLSDLTQDSMNARSHSPRNIDMISESMERVGPARPILTDENGVILAGNATHQAAMQRGIKGARVIEVDGETIVAVRISDLTPEQKAFYALADNRTAQMATWNPQRIQALIDQGFGETVEALWFPNELEALLRLAPLEQTPENTIPARVTSVGAVAPQLKFGSYKLDLTDEKAKALLEAIGKYQRAHGSFDGLIDAVLTEYASE